MVMGDTDTTDPMFANDTISDTGGSERHSYAADTMMFTTGGSDITSASGRLLVGTTSSSGSHIFEVNSGTDNEGIKVVSTDAGSYIRFADNSSTGSTRLGAVGDDFKGLVFSAERLVLDLMVECYWWCNCKFTTRCSWWRWYLNNKQWRYFLTVSRTTGTTGTNYLEFKDSGGGSGAISYHHNGDSKMVVFKVVFHQVQRLRITSDGQLVVIMSRWWCTTKY